MNERIKEFAAKAGFGPTSDPYERQAFDVNLFAELIVKDSADWIRENYDNANAELIAHYLEIRYGLHGDYA